MKIARVRIQNFRSIQAVDFDPTSLCTLIGPNNAGKSNLLEAMELILGHRYPTVSRFQRPQDFYGFDDRNRISIAVWFDIQSLSESELETFRRKGIPSSHNFGIALDYPSIDEQSGEADFDRLYFRYIDYRGQDFYYRSSHPMRISTDERAFFPLVHIGIDRELKHHLPTSKWTMLGRMLTEVDEDLRGDQPRLEQFHRSMKEAADLLRTGRFEAIEELIRSKAVKQLGISEQDLRIRFGLHDPHDLYRTTQIMVKEPGLAEHEATLTGLGAQSAIVFAIFQAYAEVGRRQAIFAIEEPELFLHPHARRHFYRILKDIAKSNQIFLTTHCPDFVDVRDFEHICLMRKHRDTGTLLIQSTFEPTDQQREKMAREFDPVRNEMFFAQRILLVEGPTERLSFPVYAEKLARDFDADGISVIDTGGKGNMEFFLNVIQSLDIPCHVVYDRDCEEFKDRPEDEVELNKRLAELTERHRISTTLLVPNYEEYLKGSIGQDRYEAICQSKAAGYKGKPVKATLVAQELDPSEIPPKFSEAIHSLYEEWI